MHRFSLQTTRRSEMINITADIEAAARAVGVQNGSVLVWVPHTTAAVTINEGADPDVPEDMLRRLGTMVPWRDLDDLHGEGNSAAHLKSSLVGCSQVVAIQDGKVRLGTWQVVWFCEFDGPRQRKVEVTAL
ncbi:YjbQ family protein [bacterium]|nr:YjbQ family protein [bacterium]